MRCMNPSHVPRRRVGGVRRCGEVQAVGVAVGRGCSPQEREGRAGRGRGRHWSRRGKQGRVEAMPSLGSKGVDQGRGGTRRYEGLQGYEGVQGTSGQPWLMLFDRILVRLMAEEKRRRQGITTAIGCSVQISITNAALSPQIRWQSEPGKRRKKGHFASSDAGVGVGGVEK